ncbi:MAG: DNA repair ATPase [Pseudomonadota bacterium]
MENTGNPTNIVEQAVAEGGAYEVIQQRLLAQGEALEALAQQLNEGRAGEFGSTEMVLASRTRVRTENNCVGRDIVQIGDLLLFGYNVFIGLKNTTQIEDVFALYQLKRTDDNFELLEVSLENSFLADPRFRHDFDELYRYYKDTRLIQLVHKGGKLLANFQIGERLEDSRVFRWEVSPDGRELTYIDNRGERDIEPPPPYDFEWQSTTRDDITHGRHPHINVRDRVFVEIVDGELVLKLENNTADGEGVYSEAVLEVNQSLDDCEVDYAEVGELLLIRILPYKEEARRHYVFNSFTASVTRIDAIGNSCVQLPEDHGLIFPGGYYLATGETRTFTDQETLGLKFKRRFRSPNGEDVLYVFYEPNEGVVALLSYNLIAKTLQNPIYGHGYALAQDGTVVVFNADHEATRIHPMQIWITPYVSEEFAAKQPVGDNFYSRIGNAELVRGVSDIFSIVHLVRDSEASLAHYEALRRAATRMFDSHFWVDESDALGVGTAVRELTDTVELVIDEFEKVEAIKRQSDAALREAEDTQQQIEATTQSGSWNTIDEYVDALDRIRKQRGHLQTIREQRYIDTGRIDEMDQALVLRSEAVADETAAFLAEDDALEPYREQVAEVGDALSELKTVAEIEPRLEELDKVASGLDLLSELIASLKISDASVQTAIVDGISQVYGKLNQTRARVRQRRDSLGETESVAQFGAQFKLFSQGVVNALSLATSPERAEDQLSRLLVQLEELESQFGESESFLADIMQKREEVYETFEAHKQRLLDQRQARAQTIADAVARMLGNVERRTKRFQSQDELNTYLASDPLLVKIRDLIAELRALDSAVKADDAEAQLTMLRDQAVRSLRDKNELYADDGRIIQLGPRHRFSVNREELDLTIIPRDESLYLHLIGTQFFERIDNERLNDLRPYWTLSFESETDDVCRVEYLAYRVIETARSDDPSIVWSDLVTAVTDESALQKICQTAATQRYKDGYQKGVHDADAAQILRVLVPMLEKGDLLRFSPTSRALGQLFWAARDQGDDGRVERLAAIPAEARAAAAMKSTFNDARALGLIERELTEHLSAFAAENEIVASDLIVESASRYLTAEIARDEIKFIHSRQAQQLLKNFKAALSGADGKLFNAALDSLAGKPGKQYAMARAGLISMVESSDDDSLAHYIDEAAAELVSGRALSRRTVKAESVASVDGLFSEHARIASGALEIQFDEFLTRLKHHTDIVVPAYQSYLEVRHEILEDARERLRLHEFKPRPLSSFVRNKLINEAYLPVIGDNLAKQIGTAGDSKRSDLSGLLMMISPPGYGKTTLMEYVASRLGLTFVKINAPALGHRVESLDPETAPDSAAESELLKLNFALEMGDNVMLYVDDIQHTNPAFLQKFISLCDSTRRIEGVWNGKTRTYDLRGRKFCVVMAGNPYTESGEAFRVPDMLANRADIYNLGDILSGKESQFELSYIENSLTANPVLAPLATRDFADVYRFVDMARGRPIATTELSHTYSAAEVGEITRVLEHMFKLQTVILKVNQQYIASAAQEDKYRVEPRFLLQGSYRNMNKLAEKVSAVMNDAELEALLDDHYRGEAQLLTQGTEANLLKLAELRGAMTDEQAARWEQVRQDFLRSKAMGGDESDVGTRITAQLADLVSNVGTLGEQLKPNGVLTELRRGNDASSEVLTNALDALRHSIDQQKTTVNVTSQPSPEFGEVLKTLNDTIEHTLFPLVRSMDMRIAQDIEAYKKLEGLIADVETLKSDAASGS